MFTVAGIGEILWDLFDQGKQIGGAPANIVFHLRQLGINAYPISAIGEDKEGEEIITFLEDKKISTKYITKLSDYSTGTVQVTLQDGKPSYTITKDVAWDNIPFTAEMQLVCPILDAICYGTLASRNSVSADTILKCLKATSEKTKKIFDINLRQNFYTDTHIDTFLQLSDVLKVSDEEIPYLQKIYNLPSDYIKAATSLCHTFDLEVVALTLGGKGATLITKEQYYHEQPLPVNPVNTVGCGDSFTAGFLYMYLQKKPLHETVSFANYIASYVSTQPGAMPDLSYILQK